jgi:hypothetical protein
MRSRSESRHEKSGAARNLPGCDETAGDAISAVIAQLLVAPNKRPMATDSGT